jgi:hypothetical protein
VRAYDLSSNDNLDNVAISVVFNGALLIDAQLTAGGGLATLALPDENTVTVTGVLDGYVTFEETIMVDGPSTLLIGLSPDVTFLKYLQLMKILPVLTRKHYTSLMHWV